MGLALTMTAACHGSVPPPSSSGQQPQSPVVAEELPTERLRRLTRGAPAAVDVSRDPFRFGSGPPLRRGAGATLAPLPAPEDLPELPLPLAAPPLRLLGIATEAGGARVAMLRVGGDLELARPGDVLAGRYRVVGVADDGVDLVDAVGDRPLRLALP
jgi:hypothetical protein